MEDGKWSNIRDDRLKGQDGKSHQVSYTDGETHVNSIGLFQKLVNASKLSVHYTKGHLAFAKVYTCNCKPMLEMRIKPRQQWTALIYPILLTYNNKLVRSTTKMTPKETSKQEHGQHVYVNLNLKATHIGNSHQSLLAIMTIFTPMLDPLIKLMYQFGPMMLTISKRSQNLGFSVQQDKPQATPLRTPWIYLIDK